MVLHLHMGDSTTKRSTPFLKALTPIISLAFIGACIQFYRANNGFTAIHFSFVLTGLILLVTAFLIFGGKKIPEIARGIGKGMREFKNARDDIQDSIEKERIE